MEIDKNINCSGGKKCAIAYTTHKNTLCGDELMTLDRLYKIFGQSRDVYLVTKQSTSEKFYADRYPNIKFVHVPDIFMHSYQTYNRMCMSIEFYQNFQNYEYLLMVQPDVYTFKDNLDYFMDMGYEYYGAPLVNCPSWGTSDEVVGCGGLSLRKVSKFIQISRKFDDIQYIPEDLYFCMNKNLDLKKCTVDISLEFCFSSDTKEVYEYWLKRTNGKLPSFCHIFKKNNTWDFWKEYITECETKNE